MPTIGTKQMLKVQRLTEGKNIPLDLSVFLHDILETTSVELDASSKHLKNLPEQVKLSIKGVEKVSAMLDEAIAFDGYRRLVHDLLQSSAADDHQKRVIEERLQARQSPGKRKSCSEERLRAIPTSLQPPMKKAPMPPKVTPQKNLECHPKNHFSLN